LRRVCFYWHYKNISERGCGIINYGAASLPLSAEDSAGDGAGVGGEVYADFH
jgi:hypothetical protein